MEKTKAFVNHRNNGFLLNFPNGNSLSTIWGRNTYCDNYDLNYKDDGKDNIDYTAQQAEKLSSNTCEVMTRCSELVYKLLCAKFPEAENGSVFGHLTFPQWLEMVNILNENK